MWPSLDIGLVSLFWLRLVVGRGRQHRRRSAVCCSSEICSTGQHRAGHNVRRPGCRWSVIHLVVRVHSWDSWRVGVYGCQLKDMCNVSCAMCHVLCVMWELWISNQWKYIWRVWVDARKYALSMSVWTRHCMYLIWICCAVCSIDIYILRVA